MNIELFTNSCNTTKGIKDIILLHEVIDFTCTIVFYFWTFALNKVIEYLTFTSTEGNCNKDTEMTRQFSWSNFKHFKQINAVQKGGGGGGVRHEFQEKRRSQYFDFKPMIY